MTKNTKKRALSETEVTGKPQGDSGDAQHIKNKKKKFENKVAQNGQSVKSNKPDIAKKPKQEQNKDTASIKQKNKPPGGQKPELTVEQVKARIQEIESRETLSATAKRKLRVLKIKLRIAEGVPKPEPTKKQAAKGKQVGVKVDNAKAKPAKAEKKQGSLLLIKKSQDDDDDDDEDDEDEDDESPLNTTKEDSDEEMASDTVEDGEDEEEDEDDDDDEEEDEDEEEEEDEEDEEEEDEDENVISVDVKSKKNAQKEKESPVQEGKKKRFVLFVGNLPYTATTDDIRKHFLTKVKEIVDVRIPPGDSNKNRGYAYVELANSTDYEKGLSLHHSSISGRRINVQYSGADKVGVAKNLKLNALRKIGKIGGGPPHKGNKKFGGKKGKQA